MFEVWGLMNLKIKKRVKDIFSSRIITKVAADLLPSTVAVLLYHDLSEDDDFSSWMRVKKTAFELQMSQLRGICNFIHPPDLFQKDAFTKNRLNVLLTFDDGFVNQYTLGLPVLRKFKIPALFFVSTENIESGDIFWFDRIVTPIQALGIDKLDLQHLGLKNYHFFSLNGAKRWNDIQVLLQDIKAKGNDTSPDVRRIINYFGDSFPDIMEQIPFKYRPLNKAEILEMKSTKLCYFGSHSHRHEILTYLKEDDIKANLVKSKHFLEGLLGEPIAHFSYPNGNSNSRVIALCKETGYKYGYLASPGLLKRNTFPMSIPRITVSGYDTIESILWKINREYVKSLGKFS